jgi:four helix bundle protein
MNREELKNRTKEFALRIIKLVNALPNSPVGKVIGNQLLRAGTSVGANYRAACRAKSKSDFIYKIYIVEEEADESAFWLELIVESGLMPKSKIESLLKEANELTAIFVSTNKTAKSKK